MFEFKKLASAKPATKISNNSFAKIYTGENTSINPQLSCTINLETAKAARMAVGDRVALHLAKDQKGNEWLLVETDPTGAKLVSNAKKRSNEDRTGQYYRVTVKVGTNDWIDERFHTDEQTRWDDKDVQTKIGSIAFPLSEPKKTWF
jgi:hypothetical protein